MIIAVSKNLGYDGVINKTLKMTTLAEKTTIGLGGKIAEFYSPTSSNAIIKTLKSLGPKADDLLVLGGGSNIVANDIPISNPIIQVAIDTIEWEEYSDEVIAKVGAGINWDNFVKQSVDKKLSGIECLSGIPGHVGATPIQNVGAYGQQISDTMTQLKAIDRQTHQEIILNHDACAFGYRESIFKNEKKDRYIITEVHFRLQRSGLTAITYPQLSERLKNNTPPYSSALVREHVLKIRNEKAMVYDPKIVDSHSAGSFFINPILDQNAFDALTQKAGSTLPGYQDAGGYYKTSAAWLIEHAGFSKGFCLNNSKISLSNFHTLALVNRGGGSAKEVIALAETIQSKVYQKFGILLVAEPNFWGISPPLPLELRR